MGRKKLMAVIKLQMPAGQASPAPPVGPALGQHGVNIMDFVQAYNEQTANQIGTIVPVEINVYEDRSFTFITKTPPAAVLLRQAARVSQGIARTPQREGRLGHQGPGEGDRRDQDARPQRQRHRDGHEDRCRNRPLDGFHRRGLVTEHTTNVGAREPLAPQE